MIEEDQDFDENIDSEVGINMINMTLIMVHSQMLELLIFVFIFFKFVESEC